MRTFFIKLLLRLLADRSYVQVNDKVVREWLISLADEKSGYQAYYTLRKKAILNTLSIGVEQKEYWFNLGRLAELKQINQLSSDFLKKADEERRKK